MDPGALKDKSMAEKTAEAMQAAKEKVSPRRARVGHKHTTDTQRKRGGR